MRSDKTALLYILFAIQIYVGFQGKQILYLYSKLRELSGRNIFMLYIFQTNAW